MKIAVFGSGYVGLVAGACFADVGNQVTCVDIDQEKIDRLKNGDIPIYEPGLSDIVKRNVSEERLVFTTDIKSSIESCKILIIAVGTPPGEDGSADLQHVLDVAKSIGTHMNEFKVVVDKSTVPIGTAGKVSKEVGKHTKQRFAVVSNPEFLKEGDAISDFMKPDRVIIGTSNPEAADIMRTLYLPFVRTGRPIIVMDEKSAELTKYAANAILATKISFMNEIANLCDRVGADIDWVRKGIGTDSRIGPYFIFPGTGYGGSCFPKDVKAIIRTARENDFDLEILSAVEKVNETQKTILLEKIKEYFKNNLNGKTFAVWGLAFKPRTDDMREAPAINMINSLNQLGATVRAHDPQAMKEAKRIFGDRIGKEILLLDKRYDCLEAADALIIMTEWNQFREPDFYLIKETLKKPAIFDGRNLYQPKRMRELGIDYFCIGRSAGASPVKKAVSI
jgi:UDPglucose 6-dehydrogenase